MYKRTKANCKKQVLDRGFYQINEIPLLCDWRGKDSILIRER